MTVKVKPRRVKVVPAQNEDVSDIFSHKWIGYTELKALERQTGKSFKRGRFSKAETEVCFGAVDEYLKSRGLDRQEFIDMMFVRNNEKSFVRSSSCGDFFLQVAGKLKGRPVVNVYHFLRRKYHPSNRGDSWTPELDEELKRLYTIHGPQWEKIGKELDRFHIACRDRFRKIRSAYSRGPWTPEEERKLKDAFDLASKGQKPQGVAMWNFISDCVGSRSDLQCQWKWTEYLSFRSQHPDISRVDWRPSEDRLLVAKIYELGVESQKEINWNRLLANNSKEFSRFTQGKLRNRWYQLKKRIRCCDALTIDQICEALTLDLAPLSPSQISSDQFTAQRD